MNAAAHKKNSEAIQVVRKRDDEGGKGGRRDGFGCDGLSSRVWHLNSDIERVDCLTFQALLFLHWPKKQPSPGRTGPASPASCHSHAPAFPSFDRFPPLNCLIVRNVMYLLRSNIMINR